MRKRTHPGDCDSRSSWSKPLAEELNLISRVPKFNLLDDDVEQKLLLAAKACKWKPSTFEPFRDVIILARDTGMR